MTVDIIFYTGTNCYDMVNFTEADISQEEKDELKNCKCDGTQPWAIWNGDDYTDGWAGDWLIKFNDKIRVARGNYLDSVSDV